MIGDEIEAITKYDRVNETDYNAIIEVMDGQIIKIFSIHGNVQGW